jgi:hypothetical protein
MTGGGPDELVVQVDAGGSEPPRLLILSRPVAGRVLVREWAGAAPMVEEERSSAEVLADLERAQAARRRVSVEPYRLRLWLNGQGR